MARITFNDLPYNRQVLLVVREAVIRGASPQQVLTGARRWLIVWGYLSETELMTIPPGERAQDSAQAASQNFFTRENELMRFEGKTYALSSVWTQVDAEEAVRGIINDDNFGLEGIVYET